MKQKLKAIPFDEFKRKLLSDPKVKKAYDDLQPEFEIASQMIAARIKKKLTQAEVARRAKTGQAVIARLEGMNAKPSLSLLTRVAQALGTKLQITIG